MASEDGEVFIKSLAQFVRTHEKALANALQLRRQHAKHAVSNGGDSSPTTLGPAPSAPSAFSTTSALASALSLGALSFTSQSIKPAKLTLTPHHLFYLLSKFEELGIEIGSMNVRLENLHSESSPANYVSFLSDPPRSKGRSDRDSIHSVSSVRSSISNISSFWTGFGSGGASKTDKAQAQLQVDLKYLYSAFTKIPCLRLSPDRRARLISGYEEFPFDTAVPLVAFKNVSALEICDLDFRSFFGWDRMADQLRSLSVKRSQLDDPLDLLVHIVLDDMDKRRRRSSKTQSPPTPVWPTSLSPRHADFARMNSAPGSPVVHDSSLGSSASPRSSAYLRGDTEIHVERSARRPRGKSASPSRANGRPGSSYRHVRGSEHKMRRSGSGSSNSSTHSLNTSRSRSSSNLLSMGILPASKWRFLRHLCLADNSLTSITASGLSPLANTLHSLDLSSNLLTEVPDCLAILTALRALNLSNCMIDSLHSLARNPLPAITALNLRGNRLTSIAGVERMLSLERLDIRDNKITDPTEMARLTGIPDMREIWVHGNPFVRSHGTYRVTIFNLFRGSPDYAEDIIIDSSGPGYSERRQLRERAKEGPPVQIMRPPSVDFDVPAAMPDPTKQALDSEPSGHILLGARPIPHSTQSEATVTSSARRKRVSKRRIVDLSADEAQNLHSSRLPIEELRSVPMVIPAQPTHRQAAAAAITHISRSEIKPPPDDPFVVAHSDINDFGRDKPRTELTSPLPLPLPPAANLVLPSHPLPSHLFNPPPPPPSSQQAPPFLAENALPNLGTQLQGSTLSGDAYRQKVQALKDEFGSGWLRVLSEEGWKSGVGGGGGGQPSADDGGLAKKNASAAATATGAVVRHDLSAATAMRPPSQTIVSGSRTLG